MKKTLMKETPPTLMRGRGLGKVLLLLNLLCFGSQYGGGKSKLSIYTDQLFLVSQKKL